MFKFMVARAIEAASKREGIDVQYLLALHAASPGALGKFAAIRKLAAHREAAPIEAFHAAKLVGALTEDCGPCIQTEVNLARKAGMGDAQIEAVLHADIAAMSADTATGFGFARAIVSRGVDQDERRQAVRTRWGDKGVIDLTLALQTARFYPMLKTGLGFASVCQRVNVGTHAVDLVRSAA